MTMGEVSGRVLCWWSAGVASAMTAKIAQSVYADRDVIIVYCDTSATEHEDNLRFLRDCERWYGQPIVRLRSLEYRDTWDVFKKTGWLVGSKGARCTVELKKRLRQAYERADDLHLFGFTADERKRVRRFVANNHELRVAFPLVERNMTHADCFALLKKVGIEIPAMYKLGYRNNNCIGCVKGGMGYWNKVRIDFPETFDKMARLERELGATILRDRRDGSERRLYLDELTPGRGRYAEEAAVECGIACGSTLQEIGR